MAAERRARAMGTDVSVVVVGDDALTELLADMAVRRIEELESRWSRFRPDSDVSRVNAALGRPVEVSADTILLARTAIAAWRVSAGFVDCTELAALVAAGYDRSFELLPADRPEPITRRPLTLAGPADIRIHGSTITMPPGAGLDPGGIGKGLAADVVSDELLADGAAGVCVNVGGDLRVRGVPPDGRAWTISVDHPRGRLALLGLRDGAVASSTTLRRQWLVGGRRQHHLLDPRTGHPTDSDVEFAAVVTDRGWRAEALAKAVLIRGGATPLDLVDGTGAEALLVRDDGTVEISDGCLRFTGGQWPSLQEPSPPTMEVRS